MFKKTLCMAAVICAVSTYAYPHENHEVHKDTHISHQQTERIKELESLAIAGGVTMIDQGTSGNNEGGAKDAVDGSYSVDIELSSRIGGGNLFVLAEAGGGNGLDDDEIMSFWKVNQDAGPNAAFAPNDPDSKYQGGSLTVTEAWYEKAYAADSLIFTVGKLTLANYMDTNELANDETLQFLAPGFVNNIAIDFPGNSAAMRLSYSPVNLFNLTAAIQSGDGDWEDITRDLFYMVEADLNMEIAGLAGNYRVFFWNNQTAHTSFSNPSDTTANGIGFGISLDQQLTSDISIFTRFGSEDDDLYDIATATSFGLAISGTPWNRSDDVIAVAYGIAQLSNGYEKTIANPANENSLEAYYNLQFNENISITPDLQLLTAANGDDNNDSIVIGGIRLQFTF